MKKKKAFPKKTALLLIAAVVLLAGSGIGSARAALAYYSENYTAQIDMSEIGVTLNENGEAVSYRDYDGDEWNASGSGTLLAYMNEDGFKLTPGKKYDEAISVTNSGSINSYVRVIIKKSWQAPQADADGNAVTDADGNTVYVKDTTLDPSWIELNILGDNGWIAGESTSEKAVYYYAEPLAPEETTGALSDTIRINNQIAASMTKVVDGNTITYVYDYNGYRFTLEAEVDAVQTHNAADAIKSAWGVDVTMNGDTIASVQE